MQLNQVLVAVTNITTSVDFYKRLGFELIVLTETYARFIVPANQATFSLEVKDVVHPNENKLYFECEEVDVTYQQLKNAGIEFIDPPTDKPWLWREAYFTDPDGNKLCLFTAGENRLNPPWRLGE